MFDEAKNRLKTVRDFMRFAVSRFTEAKLVFGHGCLNAYDEAAYLILHTLHLPIDQLDPYLDARLLPGECDALLKVLARRVNERIPAAYLTREAWLGEFRFYVDERVIVPRSFIAELLLSRLSPWIAEPDAVTSALDLCTGSGCLAIVLAHAFAQADIDAVDLSPEALAVAQHNVADYELQGRINLVRSDLFTNLGDKRYDLIISNPPYVNAVSVQALPAEYLHEPALALSSGDDGLEATRIILAHAARHLNENGILVVEIGHNRERVEETFPTLPFTWLDTSAGDEYVFLLTRQALLTE